MNFPIRINIFLLVMALFSLNVLQGHAQDDKNQEQTTDDVMPTKYALILYSDNVIKNSGNNQKIAAHWLNRGGGSFTWNTEIPISDDYEIAICYSAKKPGSHISIASDRDSITAGLTMTSGYYPSTHIHQSAMNFERKKVPGKIFLEKGAQSITLKLISPGGNELELHSIEFIPHSKNAAISYDLHRADKSKPNMDWFTAASYGVMFHWTSQSAPKQGPIKPYESAVNAFNVGDFVKMVGETGAKYVIFTTNHAEPYFPAPLKTWEKEYPGHTTQRDLIKELADSLEYHHIKLILYLATHIYARNEETDDAGFERLNLDSIREIGKRYKTKVAGYWLDGWYQSYAKHPSFNFEQFYKASKVGNPDRLLCLNSWLYPALTTWQDYWPGEFYRIGTPSESKIFKNGPGIGLQTHQLVVMETDDWLHTKIDTPIPDPALEAGQLLNFINKQRGKGPLTINIQIYQDGHISDEARHVMETLRKGSMNQTTASF